MKTYSILLAWQDNDPEQGEFGWTGRAENVEEAEGFARKAMKESYIDQYYDPEEDGDDVEHFIRHHLDEEGNFGGRLIDCHEGAIWRAGDLERCLCNLFNFAPNLYAEVKKSIEEIDNG